ncbi:MAG TPA: NADH:ubiquinone reductase (Na(+)-transporting) subunit D [Flavobacteriales bacterium]|jgi:Na+-transporting NADH:ubiquinone oxidoreductase subunit D|nr:NADH:ubiquinone reductase (Na(+)-transporting) subunit D [Flavobacteriales bacterium]HIB77067.1 NADH:ubiquinone reductase (Na(+)-transporting) subunit D [Flavobacteriales bacterium]HIO15518.1 NADH:ubiquinone reductase (Na(+)-transporting) subunit D [Flavobacteriales bacterium]HIO59921.1 NADH:ubiquinone reductase (Na(+)-transporting) subunit D [Flavobacteriales bacterium]
MSTENSTATSATSKRESLFSKKNKRLLKDPLGDSNPITIQVLGICSALAITVQLQQAVIMSLSVLFVMIGGNLIVSMLRNLIPDRIRIIVQLVIIASLVIIVDEVLKAYLPDVSEKLSVFVGLIITNCIIMGRLEAFALANKPGPSVLDAIGNGLGYAWILLAVSVVREIFGSGAISMPGMGQVKFLPEGWFISAGGFYENNNLMILPPMALVVVGVIIWIQRSRNKALIES